MNSALDSLSKVFTQRIFRIPDYQRGYAWTEQQVQEFWTDLVSLDEGKDHYFGVLTLESVPQAKVSQWKDDTWLIRERGFSPYYVVDGQQRLTTALILIQTIIENIPTDLDFNYQQPTDITHKYIVEKRKNGLQSFIFGYEEDNPSYEFLKTQIFGSSPETHTSDDQTIYTKNLQAAKSYFLERIQSMPLEQREVLFKKVTQHFLFNLFSMSGEIDVCVAFEAMNNRGKRLTYLELLKNRLIYLTTRIEADATERKQLRDQINEASTMMSCCFTIISSGIFQISLTPSAIIDRTITNQSAQPFWIKSSHRKISALHSNPIKNLPTGPNTARAKWPTKHLPQRRSPAFKSIQNSFFLM
jgi:uncharacterized protein with ParB-like and HNH nuclease domain